jgi:hypothetical protein
VDRVLVMNPFMRRIRKSRAQRLAEDVDRATRWVQSVVITANHTPGLIVPETVEGSVVILRVWSDYVSRWARS